MKNPKVNVDYRDGEDDENYTGPGVFVRHLTESQSENYSSSGEPHCIVKCSDDDPGSVFPTRCIEFAEGAPAPMPGHEDYLFLRDSTVGESKGGQQLLKWLREAERNEKLTAEGEVLRFELVKSPEFAQWVRSLDMDGQRWLAIVMNFALAKRDKQSPTF